MAVEITYLSVVLRKDSLGHLGGHEAAVAWRLFMWQPQWFREDDHLLATSFMTPRDTRAFGTALGERTGLARDRDWVVVDAGFGPLADVGWLGWSGGVGKLSGVWLQPTEPGPLARIPALIPGWPNDPGARTPVCVFWDRDCHEDPGGRLGPDGERLPAWGGKNVWVFADPRQPKREGQKESWAAFGPQGLDFMTY